MYIKPLIIGQREDYVGYRLGHLSVDLFGHLFVNRSEFLPHRRPAHQLPRQLGHLFVNQSEFLPHRPPARQLPRQLDHLFVPL
jgi:hypothetical protein